MLATPLTLLPTGYGSSLAIKHRVYTAQDFIKSPTLIVTYLLLLAKICQLSGSAHLIKTKAVFTSVGDLTCSGRTKVSDFVSSIEARVAIHLFPRFCVSIGRLAIGLLICTSRRCKPSVVAANESCGRLVHS